MARLVDHEALLLDLRAGLAERPAWGRDQIRGLIDELEQKHRVSESDDMAVIRRFGGHLYDTFIGLVPRPFATTGPLAATDPSGTFAAMSGGAITDHTTEGTACPPSPPPQTQTTISSRPAQDSPRGPRLRDPRRTPRPAAP